MLKRFIKFILYVLHRKHCDICGKYFEGKYYFLKSKDYYPLSDGYYSIMSWNKTPNVTKVYYREEVCCSCYKKAKRKK